MQAVNYVPCRTSYHRKISSRERSSMPESTYGLWNNYENSFLLTMGVCLLTRSLLLTNTSGLNFIAVLCMCANTNGCIYVNMYECVCICMYMYVCKHIIYIYIGYNIIRYNILHIMYVLVCLLKMKVEHFNLPPFKVVRFIKKKKLKSLVKIG